MTERALSTEMVRTVADENQPRDHESRSLIERTVQRLRDDIVEGRLKSGSRLAVQRLKVDYEVSGGTIREALSLLVSEGLAQAEAQRGFRVTPMSLADMEDLTHMRVLIECEALRESVRRGDDTWEARIASSFHLMERTYERVIADPEGGFKDWERCNRNFHAALLSACPSVWSRRFQAMLYLQMERYRRLTAMHHARGHDVQNEHRTLRDLALARDAEGCASMLKLHIEASTEAVRQCGLLS